MSMLRLEPDGYALFDTAIGRCAIAWTAHGVCGVQIPEDDEASTQSRLLRRWADTPEAAPPPDVADVIARCVALMEGQAIDFADCRLDLRGTSDFERQVYAAALTIPPGRTLTYGEVAQSIGDRGAARAVGGRSAPIRFRSWCRATGWSRRVGRAAGSRRREAPRPSSACWRSSGPDPLRPKAFCFKGDARAG